MTLDEVTGAYAGRAAAYSNMVGRVELWPQEDHDLLFSWAGDVDGPIIDVGCGPGHWTDLLRRHGADIEGIDPTPEFIDTARARFPLTRFRVGRAEDLGVPDASHGGVLAWFSLIHTEPASLDVPLREFARAIRPGGSLLIGFFAGAEGAVIPHPITTAYSWSVEGIEKRLRNAGFEPVASRIGDGPATRAQAVVQASRVLSA